MKIQTDNKGMVLIMVMIFILASMAIGTALVRSSTLETKIVANERIVE